MRKLLCSVMFALLLLSGCSSNSSVSTPTPSPAYTSAFQATAEPSSEISLPKEQAEALAEYISVRKNAVKNKDADSFLSLFNFSDSYYLNEQKSWFNDCVKQPIKNYDLKIISSLPISQLSFIATINETFLLGGEKRDYTYDLVFEYFEDGYKETGPNMLLLSLNGFNVYYDEEAEEYAREIESVYETKTQNLYSFFGYTPSFVGQAKVYASMETMQGTIKPSTPNWVAGWNEYMQSIKIARYENVDFSVIKDYIDQTILHEQIHSMLSDLSSDNLAYFMQEGFAMLFSSSDYELTQADKSTLKTLYKNNYYLLDLDTLESTHLEELQTPDSTYYYLICKAYGYIIYRDHGKNSINQLLAELKTKEYMDVTANDKLDELNIMTNTALKDIMGESTDTLTQKLDSYIRFLN